MRTETKTINIYKLNELNQDIQYELIEKEQESLFDDFMDWNIEEFSQDTFISLLNVNNIFLKDGNELMYINGWDNYRNDINMKLFITIETLNKIFKIFTPKEMENFNEYDELYHSGFYIFDNKQIDNCDYLNAYDEDDINIDDFFIKLEKLRTKTSKLIEDIIFQFCSDISDYVDHITNVSSAKEALSDYEFLKDGTLYQ